MPLSEHEQRMLEEIERSLLDEDPKFASAVRASDPRQHALKRMVGAGALFLLGVGLLVLALVTKFTPAGIPVLGIGAFVVMFGAVLLGAQAYRQAGRTHVKGHPSSDVHSGPEQRGEKHSMLDRLEQRWRRRHDDRF